MKQPRHPGRGKNQWQAEFAAEYFRRQVNVSNVPQVARHELVGIECGRVIAERPLIVGTTVNARNKARIAFPWPLRAAIWLFAAVPPGLSDPLLRRLPEKG